MRLLSLSVALLMSVVMTAQTIKVPHLPGKRTAMPAVNFDSSSAMTKEAGTKHTKVVLNSGQQRSAAVKRNISDADPALLDGRTVYGAMVNSLLWSNLSITQVPYGIYSFALTENPAPEAHITDMGYDFMSGAWGRDRHYAISVMNVMGTINGTHNVSIDTKNWKEISNITKDRDKGTYSLVLSTIAYDPTDDQFYGFQYKEDLSGLNWVRVNTATAEFEQIANYRGNTQVMTLAAMPNGQFYYIDSAGDLYSLNKSNGRSSLIGNTGVNVGLYNQAMTYDGKTGKLLWAAQTSEGSELLVVDPATAETQRVTRFKNNEQFVSLFITATEAPANAPAAVGRPQLKYDANGSLNGNITFSMPSKTYGGDDLSGNVNLNVWLDGDNLKGEDVAAGSGTISIPVTLTEGNHYIAITTDNNAGFSPLRQIYQYAGNDIPKAVASVTFEQADGKNNVNWTAAETGANAGVNRGFVDAADLTYKVLRMPDSVYVATELTNTSFEEATPDNMKQYYYRIFAVNHGHESAMAESNHILCGNSFTVPYKQEFEDPVTLSDYYTVVDNDGDGNTWRQGYSTEVRMDYMKNADADDWLISPRITMEAGNKYRFAMEMKIFTQQYPEDFDIMIGTNPNDLTTFRLVKSEREFTRIANAFDVYTADFLISETADYHVAVRYCSKKNSNASLMMIRNIGVDLVGKSLAPAQASSLTVTPDANDELKATVSFITPSQNLMGQSVGQLTKVTITRDDNNEILKTFENPEAGIMLSWTDENVPSVGLHTYTVTAENAQGVGEPATLEQFIGVYEAPYHTDFEDARYAKLWKYEAIGLDDPNEWYGWSWNKDNTSDGYYYSMYYYLMDNNEVNLWLYSPLFKMEKDAVYTLNYDGQFFDTEKAGAHYDLYKGTDAKSDKMDTFIDSFPTGYNKLNREIFFVNRDAGKYHLGIDAHANQMYAYLSASLDNISLTYRTSALAPFEISGYKHLANQTGKLEADISFSTPAVNYYKEALNTQEDLTVKIFRGRDAGTLAYTTTTKPGAKVAWTDQNPIKGINYYTIYCENKHGKSEVYRDTLYVGRDVPGLVENLKVVGSTDNKNAILSWDAPTEGANGGVMVKDELSYSVYLYDIANDSRTLIADKLTATTYTVEREMGPQELCYYAVSATMATEGEGTALASAIVLGQLYDLPFKESFANSTMSTSLWQSVPLVQGATSAGIDNPIGGNYNQCEGPQDNDGGCAYIYNGYKDAQAGAILASPKMRLNAGTGNKLSFWAYHYEQKNSTEAYVQVIVSANDNPYEMIPGAKYQVSGTVESGWKEHIVNLDSYRNSNFVSVGFLGVTGGYQEVIYLDNIVINHPDASGIVDINADDAIKNGTLYNMAGQRVGNGYKGVVIINGKKIIK